MENILIEILVGLPGSGKTHYAIELGACTYGFSCDHKNIQYVDFDRANAFAFGSPKRSVERILSDHELGHWIAQRNMNWDHWVLDGLFLTNAAQRSVVLAINKLVKNCLWENDKVTIQFVYFKEDRETCLYNDMARNREKLADITIKSADYEKPDIDELQKSFPQFNFVLIEKDVHKMNTYERLFKVHESCVKSDVMRSDTWCLGGTWGDYQGNTGNIGADDQPTEFAKLDDLLTELCPNITFLQYKKLYRDCVTIETEYEHDYYGGSWENAYFECDLRKLYDMMVKMNLIKAD